MKTKKILIWVLSLILLLLVFIIVRNNTSFGGQLPFYVFIIVAAALILLALAISFLPRLSYLLRVVKAVKKHGYSVQRKGFVLSLKKENREFWLFVAPRVGAAKTVCFINRHQYCTFLLIRADNRGRGIFRNPQRNVKRPDTTAFADIVTVPSDGVTAEKIVLFTRMTERYHVIVHKEEQPLKPGGDAFGTRVTDDEHLAEIL